MDNSGLVLVAEQNPGLANALRLGFVLAGLKAITAASGQEALETLRQGAAANKPFFAILADQALKDISGAELIKAARSYYPRITAVLMTAGDERHFLREARLLGVAGVLAKPFGMDQVLALISSTRNGKEPIHNRNNIKCK